MSADKTTVAVDVFQQLGQLRGAGRADRDDTIHDLTVKRLGDFEGNHDSRIFGETIMKAKGQARITNPAGGLGSRLRSA